MTLVTPDAQSSLQTTIIEIAKPTTKAQPGDSLIETALECVEAHEWKKAIVALRSAKALRPNDVSVDLLLLKAASNAKNRKLVRSTRADIGHRLERLPDGLIANAAALLAERKYAEADQASRAALQLDPGNATAWTMLAASYAGLGWFDQSRECLEGAARHGEAAPLDLWYVGRATNEWALDRSKIVVITLVAGVLAGMLFGIALGVATPFFTREIRVRKLSAEFREYAEHHWKSDPIPRVIAGTISLSFLTLYMATLFLISPAS